MAHSLVLAKCECFWLKTEPKTYKKIHEARDCVFRKLRQIFNIAKFNLPRPSSGSPKMLSINKT